MVLALKIWLLSLTCHTPITQPCLPKVRILLSRLFKKLLMAISMIYITQAAITMTTVLVPCHAIKSLQLIYYWASGISFTGAQSSTCDCRSVIYKDTLNQNQYFGWSIISQVMPVVLQFWNRPKDPATKISSDCKFQRCLKIIKLMLNSSPPSAVYMCLWNESALFQIMARMIHGWLARKLGESKWSLQISRFI